jgi:hypothetical protein
VVRSTPSLGRMYLIDTFYPLNPREPFFLVIFNLPMNLAKLDLIFDGNICHPIKQSSLFEVKKTLVYE